MKNLITLTLCLLFISASYAQQTPLNWSGKFENQKSFVENKGQFDNRLWKNSGSDKILYAADHGSVQIYFSKKGLTYRFEMKEKNRNRRDGDESKPKIFFYSDQVNFIWQGANANTELVAEEPTADYHTYAMLKPDNKSVYDIPNVQGYKKLTYKNLYNNIDVEYVFHPHDGIKYSLILHPGADVSQVKMKYDSNEKLSFTEQGELFIETRFGDMVDHAPFTFYDDNKREIRSRFVRNGNTISFELENYDNTKTVVIDPWVQTPVFANSNGVWEVDVDATGNAYVIGGDMPMKLRKYDNTGATLWTYNTPYDTANYWLGTMATDLAGNTYVTAGSVARILKVNNAGALQWSANGGAFDEYWCIAFNCDQTKLVVGGTNTGIFPPGTAHGVIFHINTSNGSVIASANVGTNRPGFIINDISEVRSLTASKNARYYYLTLDTIASIDDNLSSCSNNPILFEKNHTYAFGYKSENYRPNNGNSGIKAIRANGDYVYTHNGTSVARRSLTTGAIINSVTIPGGGNTTTLGFNQPHNNGLDIDASGNVYVGSKTGVYKYSATLTQLAFSATSFNVYDVAVSTNGDVIVCGATGTSSSSSRTGYVQSFAMSAAAPITMECCDANICAAGPFCTDDPAVTLTPAGTSGTWSGPGISGNGLFNPATAGVGTHTIVNTLGCGTGAIEIEVLNCVALEVCLGNAGVLTANTGTGPYTWEHTTQVQDCSGCFFGCDFPPGCSTTTTGYATFGGTGATTSTAPTAYPVRVTDAHGNTLTINSSGSLSSCTSCALAISTSSTQATCGNATGSATVNVTSGNAPYTYSWSPGGATTATISNVAGGNYTVTVTSDGGSCTQTATVTVAESGGITLSTSSTQATCGNNNGSASVTVTAGTGPFTYAWSPGGATTASVSNLAPGNYTVTVNGANSCSSTQSVTVASTNAITLSSNATATTCGNNNGTASTSITAGTGPFTYAWSPGGATTASVSNLAANTYTVTVTGAGGCTATGTVTVNASTPLSVTPSSTTANCNQSDGSASVSVSGGSGSYSYSWTPGGATTATINNVTSGNYSVSIDDGSGCTAIQSVTVANNTTLTSSAVGTNVSCGSNNDGTIDLTVSGGTGPYTYAWSPGGASTQDLSGLTAGTYSVTVTDQSTGCLSNTSYTVGSDNTMDIASVVEHETCKGYHDGSIDLTITGSNGPFTYAWTPNVGTTQDLSGLYGGAYSVTVTDQGTGCSTNLNFTVQDGYNFPVSISQDGDTLTATASPNYQWYHNGVLIPGATNQTYIITEGGYFYCIVGSQNCEFTSNTLETSCICSNSIEETSVFQGISVYPNPATDELTVEITLRSYEQASISLVDVTGRRLWMRNEGDKADEFEWKIPVSDIAAGNYFVRVNVGGQTKNVKVLVKD